MLNRDRILQGTAYKAISAAYNTMKESVVEEAVDIFFNTVSKYSASEILDNSEFLFEESTKSLDLYKNILESNCVPFYRYPEELEKLTEFVESHNELVNKEKYENILNYLTEKTKSTKDLYVLETMVIMDSENPSYEMESVDLFCDVLYKATSDKDISYMNMIESVGETLTDHSRILHSASVSSELGLEPMIMKSLRNVYTEKAGIENTNDWKVCLRTNLIMEKMMQNEVIAKNVNLSRNANYDRTVKSIVFESPIETMGDIILESVSVYNDGEMTAFEAVNELFSRETIEEILKEDTEYDEYEVLCRKLDMYENALEYVSMEHTLSNNPDEELVSKFDFMESFKDNFRLPSELTITEAYDLLVETCAVLEAGKEAFEYTADGRPTKHIAKAAGYADQDDEFRKTKPQKATKAVKEPDVKNGTLNVNKKPKLEKPGLMERIQHKALDIDAKMKGLRSKSKQLAMNVKNTGKAILKIPANLINSWKDTLAKWDAMDDHRREEFMAKPGFRKNYFKGFRNALIYGGAAYASPMMVPVVWMCHRMSKQKNMRIRNELTNELTTELKIIDSKIELADKNEDHKEKWQLMRIRDKMEHERTRVIANSKYI